MLWYFLWRLIHHLAMYDLRTSSPGLTSLHLITINSCLCFFCKFIQTFWICVFNQLSSLTTRTSTAFHSMWEKCLLPLNQALFYLADFNFMSPLVLEKATNIRSLVIVRVPHVISDLSDIFIVYLNLFQSKCIWVGGREVKRKDF